ncbi:MAG: nucleotide-binding protein [Clostridia bacterium]|nr:nucleotide-binding protein [Clostridia bacterium]
MINKYKNISIIYGASGKACALKMDSELRRLHLDEFYPIKSFILANEILSSSSILDTIKQIIASSCACIVILTFDDVEGSRVRQNVLVEIGMAMMLIDQKNCFFISEKQTLPDDFPSDLQNVINPNFFDKNDLDGVAKKTCAELVRHLGLKHYRDILKDPNYIYDYKKVLDDIPTNVFEEQADLQLDHILDEWERNVASFEFLPERIMYLAERLKFFPVFNSNDRFFRFLSGVQELIKPTEKDFELYGHAYMIQSCNFINDILDYTKTKLDKTVLMHLSNPAQYRAENRSHQFEFKEIADGLRDFVEAFEDGTYEYNWLIKVLAYEYTALAHMKYIACVDKYDESILKMMDFVIDCYEKAASVGKRNDPYSKILWQGYTQYNLTRAYENLYKVTHESAYLDKMQEYSQASIVTRRKWFTDNPYKGVFSNALSFEYFLVYKYEYELRHKYAAYSPDTPDEILQGLDKLKSELNSYCATTGLGRLYDMRDGIESLIQNVEEKNAQAVSV